MELMQQCCRHHARLYQSCMQEYALFGDLVTRYDTYKSDRQTVSCIWHSQNPRLSYTMQVCSRCCQTPIKEIQQKCCAGLLPQSHTRDVCCNPETHCCQNIGCCEVLAGCEVLGATPKSLQRAGHAPHTAGTCHTVSYASTPHGSHSVSSN
jgi:hypothetical protein